MKIKTKINIVKILLLMIFVFAYMLNLATAQISFYQQKLTLNDSMTLRDHIYIFYDKNENDFVTGNNPLEVYFYYSMYPKTWYSLNPSYEVTSCTFMIRQYKRSSNNFTLFNQTIYRSDPDFNNAKYFVKIYDGDTILTDIDCIFAGSIPTSLDSPETLQMITPTYECKACQYYEWTQFNKKVTKTLTISDYTLTLINYIKNIFLIVLNNVYILFWITLILFVILSIELIFVGVYWAYMLINNWGAKRKR